MKKWIFFSCLLIVVLTATAFLLAPSAKSTRVATLDCTHLTVDRLVLNKENWHRWWPGQIHNNLLLTYKGYTYHVYQLLPDGFKASVSNGKDSARLTLQVAPVATSKSQFAWTVEVASYQNPVKRLAAPFTGATAIAAHLQDFTTAVNAFFNNQQAVYGMNITLQYVKDSSLIATRQTFDHYPTTEEVYAMIDSLKNYIRANGGTQTDAPMLHVYTENGPFETMVAIPTKADLPSSERFQLKKMVLGYILAAEVKGGVGRVKKGEAELRQYAIDHRKIAPAIPFQSLVTDRRQQPDSSQWITRLYYPVYY